MFFVFRFVLVAGDSPVPALSPPTLGLGGRPKRGAAAIPVGLFGDAGASTEDLVTDTTALMVSPAAMDNSLTIDLADSGCIGNSSDILNVSEGTCGRKDVRSVFF